ncbi:MAG: inositol monophosphatase family protein [Alphaproteobacteria bacterium]
MSHISPVLTTLINAVKKSTNSLNRDFAEIESLQTSINGAKNFSLLSIKKVEEALINELHLYKPDYPIYKNVSSVKTNNCFLINVADNFTNFNKGLDFCGISVVIVEEGTPLATVVFNPATKKAYFAQKGKGAYTEGFRNHERLRVSGQKDIKEATITTDAQNFEKVSKLCKSVTILGTSIMDFIYCASGKFDGAILSNVDLSTLIAGTMIVKESGGYSFALEQKDFREQNFDLIYNTRNVVITNTNLNKTLPEIL